MDKLKIKEVIVVEGRSDSAKLKSIFDCDTIETGGSSLDRGCLERIASMSKTRGVIVFTDPDYPGMQIRNKVSAVIGDCKHAFVDKNVAIAHGKVGVAEAEVEAIKQAILNCATFSSSLETLSWSDFIQLDIIGNKNKRLFLYDYFKLGYGNAKTLFKRLNMAGISLEKIHAALEDFE